jgi:hypothetical protein
MAERYSHVILTELGEFLDLVRNSIESLKVKAVRWAKRVARVEIMYSAVNDSVMTSLHVTEQEVQ